jgi:hypothetical protein
MNFKLFESMSPIEAQEHLRYFLDTESKAVEAMRPVIEEAGLTLDYSIESLAPILKWILHKVEAVRVPVPETEPDWVRQAHQEGLIEFPDESKYLILRAAFYLGESFVRTYQSLKWTTGNPEFVEKNMPAVSGFQTGVEMAPEMIMENLATRIFGHNAPIEDIDKAISLWVSDVVHHG